MTELWAVTELCRLARKWGTDKCLFYTPFYHELFKDKRDAKKVLEFGIGYPETMQGAIERMGVEEYRIGASLFLWQEYFPQADIFALDNKPEIFVNEGRIRSFYCDQGDEGSYRDAIANVGSGFDIIIEDGSHIPEHQILSVKMLAPLLSVGGLYIMEDVSPPYDGIVSQIPYRYEVKEFGPARVIVIRKAI